MHRLPGGMGNPRARYCITWRHREPRGHVLSYPGTQRTPGPCTTLPGVMGNPGTITLLPGVTGNPGAITALPGVTGNPAAVSALQIVSVLVSWGSRNRSPQLVA